MVVVHNGHDRICAHRIKGGVPSGERCGVGDRAVQDSRGDIVILEEG